MTAQELAVMDARMTVVPWSSVHEDWQTLREHVDALRAALAWIDDHAHDRTPTEIQHYARRVLFGVEGT